MSAIFLQLNSCIKLHSFSLESFQCKELNALYLFVLHWPDYDQQRYCCAIEDFRRPSSMTNVFRRWGHSKHIGMYKNNNIVRDWHQRWLQCVDKRFTCSTNSALWLHKMHHILKWASCEHISTFTSFYGQPRPGIISAVTYCFLFTLFMISSDRSPNFSAILLRFQIYLKLLPNREQYLYFFIKRQILPDIYIVTSKKTCMKHNQFSQIWVIAVVQENIFVKISQMSHVFERRSVVPK